MTNELEPILNASPPKKTWTQPEAIDLCRKIEAVCPEFGCHVALTGGVLYKDGPRKDLDLLFYRIRQVETIDYGGLYAALGDIGVGVIVAHGWVTKAEFQGRPIDLFFPDEPYTGADDHYTPGAKQETT